MFCVFFVEYTLDCRDKYKYLKPLLAKWSRYYFTSLGGALTGGHNTYSRNNISTTGECFFTTEGPSVGNNKIGLGIPRNS